MPNNGTVRIIFIGDVVGKPGRIMLSESLLKIKRKFKPDLIVANGENAAGGLGITDKTSKEIFNAGVDIISGGNHMFDKREAYDMLNDSEDIIRPMNYPKSVPGKGSTSIRVKNGVSVTIANLQGRVFMEPVVDNPFVFINEWLKNITSDIILVDFHAEATAEKQAMGFYLDGRVSAVIGTHTHVPTADARILANGTAYQTDAGMTGSLDSVIGMKRRPVIKKFITGLNQRWEVAKKNVIMDTTILDIDPDSGRAIKVEPIRVGVDTINEQLG